MTTLKELKELDAKATSAPWVSHTNYACAGSLKGSFIDAYDTSGSSIARISDVHSHGGVGSQEICSANAQLIAATRNALPDLIRVIELAEDELNHVDKIIKELKNDKYGRFRPTKAQGEAIWFSVSQALTEIRKLKGE